MLKKIVIRKYTKELVVQKTLHPKKGHLCFKYVELYKVNIRC